MRRILDMVNREHTNPEKKNEAKALKWILIDSIIIGAIAMVASMPGAIPTVNEAWIMFKAFLGAFLLQLAVERGLKKIKTS